MSAIKRLSKRSGFDRGVLIKSSWSSAPGLGGATELGIRWLKSKLEVWMWDDELGSSLVGSYPPGTSACELLDALWSNDMFPSTIELGDIEVLADQHPFGDAYLAVSSAGEDYRQALPLMAALGDQALIRLIEQGLRLYDHSVLAEFSGLADYVEEHAVDLEQVKLQVGTAFESLHDLTKIGRERIEGIAKAETTNAARTPPTQVKQDRSAGHPAKRRFAASYTGLNVRNVPSIVARFPGGWNGAGGMVHIFNKHLHRQAADWYLHRYHQEHGDWPEGEHTFSVTYGKGDEFDVETPIGTSSGTQRVTIEFEVYLGGSLPDDCLSRGGSLSDLIYVIPLGAMR